MRSTDILIVDDEMGIREVLQETLEDEGYTVSVAENAGEARRLRNETRPAMVLLDIWMPDSDGITLLKEWAKNGQLTMPVVMMSGHGSIDTAVEATKIGAMDFLEKPITLQKLLATVERALKHNEVQVQSSLTLDRLGRSTVIQELRQQLQAATQQNSPVLLVGENGSPFEMVARVLHNVQKPWVEPTKLEHIVDMPVELLQRATGGVLYLGDIAQYGKNIQQGIAFLLSKAERYHTRVVCASTMPLSELLKQQSEQDTRLQSLLSGVIVNIPSLRQQVEDIAFLAHQIAESYAAEQGVVAIKFSSDAMDKLREYRWPGNFEQFKSVVGSLVANAKSREISEAEVERVLRQFGQSDSEEVISGFDFNLPLRELREELERRYFEYHIREEGGNMSRVAQKVGLERTHLYRKLKQLGVGYNRKA